MSGAIANVFLALQRQLKADTDFARCRYCGKTRQVCCGDGPGTPHREVTCAKCCGPHPRNVVRLQTESSSPD